MKLVITDTGRYYQWEENEDLARLDFEKAVAGVDERQLEIIFHALLAALDAKRAASAEWWARVRQMIAEIDPNHSSMNGEFTYDWLQKRIKPQKQSEAKR